MTAFFMIFRRFLKIFQICSEGQTNVPKHFPKISEDVWRFPKIAEDVRCFDDTPTNLIKYNLRDKLDISEIIDILTCEDISAHARISYRFYQFVVTTRYCYEREIFK